MKVYKIPKWLMPFGYGMALYKLIFIRKGLTKEHEAYVHAHEYCHVLQWTKIGFFTFIYLYIKELILNGYYNNSFEEEARIYGNLYAKDYLNV